MKHRRITTEQTPVGDWRAIFDSFEPGDAMGTGDSAYDAILDLLAEDEAFIVDMPPLMDWIE